MGKENARIGVIAGAGGPPDAITGAVTSKKYDVIVCNKKGALSHLRRANGTDTEDVLVDSGYAGFSFFAGAVIPAGDGWYFYEVTPAGGAEFLGYPHRDNL